MKVSVSSGSTPATTTKTTDSGQASSTKAATLSTKQGTVAVPAGAYSSTSDVKLDELTAAKFLNAASLTTPPAFVVAGPMTFSSTVAGTSTQSEPLSALSVKLNTSAGQSLGEDAAAIIEATDNDGKVTVFYVDHHSLSIQTDANTGQSYVDIGNVKSGNFAVALVTGLSSSTLAAKYKALPSDGTVTSTSIPTHAATSVGFTDSDGAGGSIGGTVTIAAASDESDVKSYVLYWGTSATAKQSTTPITTLAATGSSLRYTFANGTTIPTNPTATYILVYTANSNGEMATGVSVLISDLGVPVNAAISMTFTDTDATGGQIGGTVNITMASNESDVSSYVLYWGSSSTTKQSSTPIATIAKTGSNLSYSIASGTTIPTSPAATHLLVFTKNSGGEMATGISLLIIDSGVPTNAAVSMSFTDTDTNGGKIGGTVNITKASSEADVTHYVLYWGSNATTKQNATPITTIAATGGNLTYNIAANTAIPTSPTATHLLVFTKNGGGEMATGIAVAIVDVGVPTHAAASVAFTDTDTDGGQLGGTVTITKAANESDVTHYVLYWGSDATTKQNTTAITTIAVTGSNVTYNIAANTAIPSSPTATHLLVFTKNADGEMATGVSVAIVDVGIPIHAAAGVTFTDTDTSTGNIGGTVTITKAANESDVTHYVLYWGSDATTKQNTTPIATIAVTGSNVTQSISSGTSIPSSPTATHFLVFTKNADGEMATGVSVAITDNTGSSCTYGGVSVGGYCWYIGTQGMSCDSACLQANASLVYDAASNTYAGASGTQAQCKAVADAVLGGTSASYVEDTMMPKPIGCASTTGTTGGNVYRFSNTATTSTGNDAAFYRFCACH